MTPPRFASLLLAGLLLLASAPARRAAAHDILLLPGADPQRFQLGIKYGHPGDYTLPDREKLFVLDGYPADGGAAVSLLPRLAPSAPGDLLLNLAASGEPAGYAVVGARFDNGYFATVDDEHYYNTSRRELPAAKKSGHYLKFAKALLPARADHAGFDRVLGYRLEIVPQADPFGLKVGDELPVLVLFDGQPLPGAEVDVISGEFAMQKGMELPKVTTDTNGLARVRLERPGFQFIGTDHDVRPSADPPLADYDNFASTVSFRLEAK